jgi:hypothetical protein
MSKTETHAPPGGDDRVTVTTLCQWRPVVVVLQVRDEQAKKPRPKDRGFAVNVRLTIGLIPNQGDKVVVQHILSLLDAGRDDSRGANP